MSSLPSSCSSIANYAGTGTLNRHPTQRILSQPQRLHKILLVKIKPLPATIDDDKVAHFAQRDQRMVPNPLRIINALPTARHECPNLRFVEITRGRDHHQIRLVVQRHESLAAERMPFEHLHLERQRARLSAKQVDQRAAVLVRHVHLREVVIADRRAEVDRDLLRALEFDHVAERGERFLRQWFDSERFHDASVPHKRRRDTPPSGMMLKRTCVTGPSAAISLWK